MQKSPEIIELNANECEGVTGGWVHFAVLAAPFVAAGIMAAGAALAGAGRVKADAPTLDLPTSPEETGMRIQSGGGRPA